MFLLCCFHSVTQTHNKSFTVVRDHHRSCGYFLGGRGNERKKKRCELRMKCVVAAQFWLLSHYASESIVTPCHMTKRNAAKIFRAHSVIYCHLTVFCSFTLLCIQYGWETGQNSLSLSFNGSFCIQPIRNAIRNSPQKLEPVRSDRS